MLIARRDPEPPLDTRYGNCVSCGGSEDRREDQIIFLTNDNYHDVPFVELYNSLLHKHYAGEGESISRDVKYNDSCISQLERVRAFAALAHRNTRTMRIFCGLATANRILMV